MEFAEKRADAVELGAVAGRDGDTDVDLVGRMGVGDRAGEAEGEFVDYLGGGEEFEGEGDAVLMLAWEGDS